jgi:hypothetical protein
MGGATRRERARLAARLGGEHIRTVLPSFLPYALVTPSFPFRHLAALAGRAPIGGAREVALGCFVAARLAVERGPAAPELTDEVRQARALAAKSWLGTLTLPAAVRAPLAKCIESSARSGVGAIAREVAAMRSACAGYLDAGSRAELDALAEGLSRDGRVALPARTSAP